MKPTTVILVLIFLAFIIPVACADDSATWCNKAQNAASGGDYVTAVTYYQNALAVDPTYSPALAGEADALNHLGNYSAALSLSEQAISIQPSDPVALNAEGYALLQLGRYNESVTAYNQLFTLQVNHAEPYCNQGQAYLMLNDSPSAISSYTHCTAIDGSVAMYWDGLGRAYMSAGSYQDALNAFIRATGITVKNATIWDDKAGAYLALGQYQDALESANTALYLDPTFTDAQQKRNSALGKAQVYNISGTITPTPEATVVRTSIMTTAQTLVVVAPTTLPSATGIPATSAPVPEKTTYTPLSPFSAIGALLVVCGFLALKKQRR